MNKTLASLAGATILSILGTFAQAQTCEQCGTLPPPPPPSDAFVCKVRGNAGIGNKGEGRASELNDCDPGRSGLHNQAWKNLYKPHGQDKR